MILELTQQFDALMHALRQVREALLRKKSLHWLPLTSREHDTRATSLRLIADLITDVWYRDGQDGRETRSRHGLVMVDEELTQLIVLANQQKDAFRSAVQQAQSEQETTEFNQQIAGLGKRHTSLRDSLHFSGLSRLHLKQCYRHLPLLDQAPLKVGFSWYAHGRSIRKISVEEAQDKLLTLGEEKTHIQIQLAKINSLSPEQKLAQVQTLAPVVRANLVYPKDSPRLRQAMNVALPLMIPGSLLPEFNQIAPEPPEERTRQRRADQQISDEAFLPSIRVHLYNPKN